MDVVTFGAARKSLRPFIASGTLTAGAATITISADNNGRALNLQSAHLVLYTPAADSAQVIFVQLNGITGASYWDPSLSATARGYINGGKISTSFSFADYRLTMIGGNVHITTRCLECTNGPVATTSGGTSCLINTITGITAINLSNSGGIDFPIGTTYRLYGEAV